jgi:hypothetical protein
MADSLTTTNLSRRTILAPALMQVRLRDIRCRLDHLF